ncbi:MAG: hypothetical protein AB2693_27650 [Candidatus Thiodiazotropha sp.]
MVRTTLNKFHPLFQKDILLMKNIGKSSIALVNYDEVKVTKILSALKLVPSKYPHKFGGIPANGSIDIVDTVKISHTDDPP